MAVSEATLAREGRNRAAHTPWISDVAIAIDGHGVAFIGKGEVPKPVALDECGECLGIDGRFEWRQRQRVGLRGLSHGGNHSHHQIVRE